MFIKNGVETLPKLLESVHSISKSIEVLSQNRRDAIQEIVRAIERGATTGNPILDNLWMIYRDVPDREIAERFILAAKMIKGQTGQLAVIVEMKEGESPLKHLGALHAPPEPPPSFKIFVGRLSNDKLLFVKEYPYRCALPMECFATAGPYKREVGLIKDGPLGCLGFPSELNTPLLGVHPDQVFFHPEDLVTIRLIVGNNEVAEWAKNFHCGTCKETLLLNIRQLDNIAEFKKKQVSTTPA